MIPFPSSHRKLFAILIDMWAMIGVVCWAVATRNHPPIDRHIQREDCTVTTKGYSSSLGASACHHWFLKPIPEFFSPSNPVIFPCIVSKESLMSLVRNIPFETAVSPKLSHPMHKKDCLQPVVLPEWSLGAGPALFQKYQQHRVFKKTLFFMMSTSMEVHCHSRQLLSASEKLMNDWLGLPRFPAGHQALVK